MALKAEHRSRRQQTAAILGATRLTCLANMDTVYMPERVTTIMLLMMMTIMIMIYEDGEEDGDGLLLISVAMMMRMMQLRLELGAEGSPGNKT